MILLTKYKRKIIQEELYNNFKNYRDIITHIQIDYNYYIPYFIYEIKIIIHLKNEYYTELINLMTFDNFFFLSVGKFMIKRKEFNIDDIMKEFILFYENKKIIK